MISKLLVTVSLALFSVNHAQKTFIPVDPTSDTQQFGGLKAHKPGLKVRMTQAVSDLVKENLLQYGQAYLNWDLNWKRQGLIKVDSFPIYTDFRYSQLEYEPFKLDISKAALNYTHMVIDKAPVVYAELPGLKHWAFSFHYLFKYMWWHEGDIEIEANNLSAIVTSGLKATSDGHLFPYLHDIDINVEHCKLYNSNGWKQFWQRQWFELGKYIIQNAYNWFGSKLINRNLYKISKKKLNDQIHPFPLALKQLGKEGNFNLNWRMTANPLIHNKELDFSLFFDIGPEMERCMQPHDTHDYYFQDNFKNKYIQFVMSDRVPNCLLEAMERQDWFKYDVDSQFMVDHFGTHLVPINAALLKRAYPQIAREYGDEQELKLEVEFRMPRFTFGLTERDMSFETTLRLGIKKNDSLNYILYDEMDIYVEGDMSIEQEVLFANVEELTIGMAEHTDKSRTGPLYDTLNITADEYASFWTQMVDYADRWRYFLNEKVFASGVPLPYWNLEFLTKFTFHPHAMLVVLDVFYNNMEI